MKTLLISLMVLGSIGAVMSAEESWADRSKLEQRLRAMPKDALTRLRDKLDDIVEQECSILLLKECSNKLKAGTLTKETPCCKEVILWENVVGVDDYPKVHISFPTDNVALFEDTLKWF